MNGTQNEPAYRAISVIALIQTGIVTAGTLFVTFMLRIEGYHGDATTREIFHSADLFVRHYGFMLLLLPLSWASLAIFVTRRGTFAEWFSHAIVAVGVAVIVYGAYWYMKLCGYF